MSINVLHALTHADDAHHSAGRDAHQPRCFATVRLSAEQVARCNFRTAMNAVRFVYYGGTGFTFADPEGGPVLTGPADLWLRRDLRSRASMARLAA